MTLKDCVSAIQKLRPSHRNSRALGEYCERLEKQVCRITTQPSLKLVEINIVSHCNLNCRSCSHFSPVAGKEYLPIELAELDFARLAELSGGDVQCIHIMGGEPLLHP